MIDLWDFISVKGMKAQGNRLSTLPITEVVLDPPNTDKEAEAEAVLAERLAPAPTPDPAPLVEVPESPTPEQPKAAVPPPAPKTAPVKDEVSQPIELDVTPKKSEGDSDEEAPQLGLF